MTRVAVFHSVARVPACRVLPLALLAALSAMSTTAFARQASPAADQSGPKGTLPGAAQSAAAKSAAADEPATLDAVVVKGEKTDRSLQDTVSSVAVTTSARIEDENIRSLYDIFQRTANVTQASTNNGFTIRGMENTGTGQAPLVSVYLDGAAIPSTTFGQGAPFSTWDMDQLEIMRGPQSTLQGESAIAGAIVLHTQDPTMYWDWHARAQYSNPGAHDLAFAGGGPLVDDQLAFRVSLQNQYSDGFVWNPTRHERADESDDTTGRVKLLWKPKGLPGLSVKLSLTHDNYAGPTTTPDSVANTVPDYFDHRHDLSNRPDDIATHTSAANAEVNYEFSPQWTLSSVTSWTQVHSLQHTDSDGTASDDGFSTGRSDPRTRQQEFRLHFNGDWLDGLLGAYWSQRDTLSDNDFNQNLATPVATISAVLQSAGIPADLASTYANVYAQALPVIPYDEHQITSTNDRNEAVFADGTAHLGDHWSLLGGFRYDRQRYVLGEQDGSIDFLGSFPDPAGFGAPGSLPYLLISGINATVAQYLANAISNQPEGVRDFSAFLPKLGARYEWNKDLSLSFVAQRGYRAGGSSYNLARGQNFAYQPEYTTNYEASLRSQWLDETLTLNANVYYTDWKDKQVWINGPLGQYDYWTANANSARMWGFEIEASQRVNRHFDWYANLGHERTRYGSFEIPADAAALGGDLSGEEFIYAPHWTAALGANLRFGEGWFVNGNASYRSREIGTQTVDGNQMLASLVLLNGRFGYAWSDWSAYLFGNNLLDRKYLRNGSATSNLVYLGDPRVVGIGVEARW